MFLMLIHFSSQAQSLVITTSSGNQTISLVNVNTIKFSGSQMIVSGTSSSSFTISEITNMYFKSTSTGSASVTTGNIKLSVADNMLYISNASGQIAYIYRIDGALMMIRKITSDSASLSISSFSQGVYIARIGTQIFKLIKR